MTKIRFGQSGYSGASRSNRAVEAEINGRLPLSRAIPVVARQAKVSRSVARDALLASHDGEWHHTGKYARETPYYSVQAAIDEIRLSTDPLREHVEESEYVETGAVAVNATRTYRDGDVCDETVRREIREWSAWRIQCAANFRRWEPVLRKF